MEMPQRRDQGPFGEGAVMHLVSGREISFEGRFQKMTTRKRLCERDRPFVADPGRAKLPQIGTGSRKKEKKGKKRPGFKKPVR